MTTVGGLAPKGPVYEYDEHSVTRTAQTLAGSRRFHVPVENNDEDPEKAWHLSRLRGNVPTGEGTPIGTLRVVDLFCGSGGFAFGVAEAITAIGFRPRFTLAVDLDPTTVDVHAYNLNTRQSIDDSIRSLLRTEPLFHSRDPAGVRPEDLWMPGWPRSIDSADVLIGGPPCQGHSNLNNHTRRNDPRNELYLWMAAAALATNARLLLIENVPSVRADAGEAVSRTIEILGSIGYRVLFEGLLSAAAFGVAQTRKRHFLIAARSDSLTKESGIDWLPATSRPLLTAAEVLVDLVDSPATSDYDTPSSLSESNESRVRWLHSQEEFDLPDHLRPKSHRDGHTYPSVYGRMHGDRPAQTISTGFLSPGRGRFTHPLRPRSLTPHEGARLQGIPDDFRFIGKSGRTPTRTQLATMIGDAVPPPMAFYVALAGLQSVRLACD